MRRFILVLLLMASTLTTLALRARAQGPPASGSPAMLWGEVVNQYHHPLPHALVKIDSGQFGYSDRHGMFRVIGIPPGSHYVTITVPYHRQGAKWVNFASGQQVSMHVMLTYDGPPRANGAAEGANLGVVYLEAYPYRGSHFFWWPSRIEVYCEDDASKYWNVYSYQGRDNVGLHLTLHGAPLGKQYLVRVTWQHHDRDHDCDDFSRTAEFYRTYTTNFGSDNFYEAY